eukprot:4882236-Alexandrium_andersonii.AAC.1
MHSRGPPALSCGQPRRVNSLFEGTWRSTTMWADRGMPMRRSASASEQKRLAAPDIFYPL